MLDYATVFLEKADLLKYRLYSVLARPYVHDVTITDLTAMWPNKYQTTYNVFQEMLVDLSKLTDQPQATVRKALLEARHLPLGIDEYRTYLAQQSMSFHFIDELLRAPTPNFIKFCEDDFVSRSTVSRKLHPLKDMFKPYGIKLQLTKMRFVGPEQSIRYVLYSIYWWVYRGVAWPFDPITPQALHEECDQIGIFNDRPITQTQMQYFLAISHLRIGKGHKIKSNAWLAGFDERVGRFSLRKGQPKPPFARVDNSFYNYFQISQPRFDALSRPAGELPVEMALLSDPVTMTVVDRLSAAIYQPRFGDLDADLCANILRLAGGYLACGGDFPQAEDYIGGSTTMVSDTLAAKVLAVITEFPDEDSYAVFKNNAERFSMEVAQLAVAYQLAGSHHGQLQVSIDVDQTTEGYAMLSNFVNCVPWVAHVANDRHDLLISSRNQPQSFDWYPDALRFDSYRESLIAALIDGRQDLLHA